jgi:sensor histidine kinase regulating citrate/malate metabolism
MVKSIVESCKGKIWFESERNAGTKFFVSIPEYKEENVESD